MPYCFKYLQVLLKIWQKFLHEKNSTKYICSVKLVIFADHQQSQIINLQNVNAYISTALNRKKNIFKHQLYLKQKKMILWKLMSHIYGKIIFMLFSNIILQ